MNDYSIQQLKITIICSPLWVGWGCLIQTELGQGNCSAPCISHLPSGTSLGIFSWQWQWHKMSCRYMHGLLGCRLRTGSCHFYLALLWPKHTTWPDQKIRGGEIKSAFLVRGISELYGKGCRYREG